MTFFFTAVFILLVFWRPQEWLVPWLYGWPILDAVTFLALGSLLIEADQGKVRFPKHSPHVFLVIGIWVASIMSHLSHTYMAGMLSTAPLVFKTCFFTILLLSVLNKVQHLRWIAWLFVSMAALMAVHALLQERRGYGFAGETPISILPPGKEPYVRTFFFGIFGDPNDLSQILVTSIPFGFALVKRRTFLNVIIGGLLTWLFVAGVLSTHSRGGLMALITTSAVMITLLLPYRWFPFLMWGVLAGGLLMCPAAAALVGMDESAHDRLVFWGYANQAFKHNPLFGIGTNMFAEITNEARAAHNAYVLCYTELGFFGYWFWFGLIYLGLLGAWRTRRQLAVPETEDEEYLGRFAGLCIAAMAGYLVSSYFIGRAFVYPMYFLFAILGSIPVIREYIAPEAEFAPVFDFQKDLLFSNTILAGLSIIYIYMSVVMLNHIPYAR